MRKGYKIILGLIALCASVTLLSTNGWAAKKKKIKSVNIKISGKVEADTKPGNENIEVTTTGETYSVEDFSFENTTFAWSADDVPELKIHLVSDEDHYFEVYQGSQIKINGGTFKKADRQDGATSLYVTVLLPTPATQMDVIQKATFSEDGNAVWNSVEGAGNYEVKFMRNETAVGGLQNTVLNTINYRKLMTKEGSYWFKVRPISKVNPDFAGEWVDSNRVYISRSEAEAIDAENVARDSAGNWEQLDGGKWKFKTADGVYANNEWRRINKKWYYFLPDTYMAAGWQHINNNWYYLDPATGAMLANSTTPDGYFVGLTGEWIP